MDQLIRACDLFEETKRVGVVQKMTLYRDKLEGFKPVDTLEAIIKGYKMKKHSVWFVGFPKLVDSPIFIEPGINTISDGRKWCIFAELLDRMGYDTITDERRCVMAANNRLINLS